MTVEHLRWLPIAVKRLDEDFFVLLDENVHRAITNTLGGHYAMACYPKYSAVLNHVFEACEGPVTCLFCLADESKFQ